MDVDTNKVLSSTAPAKQPLTSGGSGSEVPVKVRVGLSRVIQPAWWLTSPFGTYAITAITLAELSVGPLVATSDAERSARQAHVQQAEADFERRWRAGPGIGEPRS